jgi:hypothetical protein
MESVRLEVWMWKKGMGNCEAVQWPDMNGAARQAKLSLLMLNQTTGKARDYVFESISDNALWAEACASLIASKESKLDMMLVRRSPKD